MCWIQLSAKDVRELLDRGTAMIVSRSVKGSLADKDKEFLEVLRQMHATVALAEFDASMPSAMARPLPAPGREGGAGGEGLP